MYMTMYISYIKQKPCYAAVGQLPRQAHTTVVMGNIGVGKSTLLEKLGSMGYKIVPEPIEQWSFLNKFLMNKARYAFPFQVEVLTTMPAVPHSLMERSALETVHVFGAQLLAEKAISQEESKLLHKVAEKFLWVPNVVLYLTAPPSICLERIRVRDREGEGVYDLAYIEQLHDKYETLVKDLLNTPDVKVFKVQCDIDADTVAKLAHKALVGDTKL
jgi:deoxyadenosine/deoxycytidine kinase